MATGSARGGCRRRGSADLRVTEEGGGGRRAWKAERGEERERERLKRVSEREEI